MDLAHLRLTPDFTFYMFLVEAWIVSAVIYACTTFGVFVFLPWGVPQLQSRVTGACPVTTDLIMRVNVRTTTTTTTTTTFYVLYDILTLLIKGKNLSFSCCGQTRLVMHNC